MIYRLRRKFILISTLSVVGVFAVIFMLISVFSYTSLDRTMDTLTDAISAGRGRFPEPVEKDDDVFDGDPEDDDDEFPPPKRMPNRMCSAGRSVSARVTLRCGMTVTAGWKRLIPRRSIRLTRRKRSHMRKR